MGTTTMRTAPAPMPAAPPTRRARAAVPRGMVAYRGGPLSVKPAASETKNTPALSYKLFTNDVGLRVSNSFGFMLGGKYELTPKAAIFAGVEHTDQTIPSSSN